MRPPEISFASVMSVAAAKAKPKKPLRPAATPPGKKDIALIEFAGRQEIFHGCGNFLTSRLTD
jgi:hypothetical protein